MNSWTAELAATAPEVEPEADVPPDAEAVARELAKLSPLAYDQRREEEAKRLSVRAATLDKVVSGYRKAEGDEEEDIAPFTDPDPWHKPVNGAVLLDDMVSVFERFLVLPDHSAQALALWCIHAHAHDAADISPILAVLSPEKQCGKTTTIKVVSTLVPRPMHTVNTTQSVLFRVVEKYKPTVLVDEGDTFLKDNDDLKGIINGGHDRMSAFVWRNVGDDHEPRRFKVWAPKAIAMIGQLPDTLEDRSIVVPLRRRRNREPVERFRADRTKQFLPLMAKAARWAADNLDSLADRDPALPEKLDDRAHDNWRILIAIADQASGHWPETARASAMGLSSAAARGGSNVSRGVLLLRDIREAMGDRESMSSTALLGALIGMDESPWGEWRGGKPITTSGIARMLKPFKVGPHRGRTGSTYRASDLQDPWSRYLDQPVDHVLPATCHQGATKKDNDNNGVLHVAGCGTPTEGAARVQHATENPESSGTVRGAI